MKINDIKQIKRISLINKTVIQDPERTIRKRFKGLCNFNKSQKKKIDPVEFDADGQIKERRIQALMNSLKTVHKYGLDDEWINLNIFTQGYSRLESTSHILYAAAIWILDRIEETDYDRKELYRILPTDKNTVYKYVPTLDIWDSMYDPDLISSVEYLIYTRNMDIAPLEKNGLGGYRVIADSVSARGKANGDTPCRQRFEKLLSMIPQNKINLAVNHFKRQYDSWCESYFTLVSFYENNCAELRKPLNDIAGRFNTAVGELEAIEAEMDKIIHNRYQREKKRQQIEDILHSKINSPVKRASIVKNLGIQLKDGVKKIGRKLENDQNEIDFRNEGDRKEYNNLISEWKAKIAEVLEMSEKYDSICKKYNHALKQKRNAADRITWMVLIDPTGRKNFSDNVFNSIKRKIFEDPFEMCFALLYLIETNSDIPWNYGSCIGMMKDVVSFLPWEDFKQYDCDSVFTMPSHPIIPNWLKREYEKDYNSAPLSLAHIIYRETGCVMPRDMHKFDSIFEVLKEYGITGNKAVGLLYCMLSLDASRNSMKALNFNKEYMRKLDGINNDNLPKTDEQIEIQRLRKELHDAKNETKQRENRYNELMAKYKAEHQEVADLREIVFNADSNEQEVESNSSFSFPYEIKHNTVIFGGHESWVKEIKNKLNGNVRYVSKDFMSFDPSLIRNAEAIWVQWNAIPHGSFYRISDEARKNQKAIRYFTNFGVLKCAEQAALHDIKLC